MPRLPPPSAIALRRASTDAVPAAERCRTAGVHDRMPHAKAGTPGTAKLLVVLLAFAWGLNWIAAAVALREVTPWSLRVAGSGIGAITLFAAVIVTGHQLRIPR